MLRLLLAAALAAAAGSAAAQHDHAADAHTTRIPSGLSADDVAGLLSGAGLGMARPAELHGYPGPLHVIELAEPLQLTDAQRATAERLRSEMLAAAVPLGRQLVDAERSLDAVFLSGAATAADVERAVAQAAAVHARLRATHLRAHLAMREALTEDQLRAYARLRGHDDVHAGRGHGGHAHD
jgi:Spy/CpxP family protein refolding chaperone